MYAQAIYNKAQAQGADGDKVLEELFTALDKLAATNLELIERVEAMEKRLIGALDQGKSSNNSSEPSSYL